MHSAVYTSIWFKLGMMADTTVLYILILVYLSLALIQGHCVRVRESKNFWAYCLTNFLISLNGIWDTIETHRRDEPHARFVCVCVHSVFKGETPTYVILFIKKKKSKTLILACIQTYSDQFLPNLVWW